jgi:hypothetical protein
LDDEYITTKLLTLLGDADKVEDVMQRKMAEQADRYTDMGEEDIADEEDLDTTEEEADLDNKYLSEFSDDILKMLEELVGED